jgi:hypothetical protein
MLVWAHERVEIHRQASRCPWSLLVFLQSPEVPRTCRESRRCAAAHQQAAALRRHRDLRAQRQHHRRRAVVPDGDPAGRHQEGLREQQHPPRPRRHRDPGWSRPADRRPHRDRRHHPPHAGHAGEVQDALRRPAQSAAGRHPVDPRLLVLGKAHRVNGEAALGRDHQPEEGSGLSGAARLQRQRDRAGRAAVAGAVPGPRERTQSGRRPGGGAARDRPRQGEPRLRDRAEARGGSWHREGEAAAGRLEQDQVRMEHQLDRRRLTRRQKRRRCRPSGQGPAASVPPKRGSCRRSRSRWGRQPRRR